MTDSSLARRTFVAAVGALLTIFFRPQQSLAGLIDDLFAPDADLWPRWAKHDSGSTLRVDPGTWDGLLKNYIRPDPTGINRVAYGDVTPADRAVLEEYLARLSVASVSRLDRREQLAYWVNLYSALTVRLVLAHYPLASIRRAAFCDKGDFGQPV